MGNIILIILNQLLIMNPTIQIHPMITSIAYTTEVDQALIQMTISPIILNQLLITSIDYTMEEDKGLIKMTISLIICNQFLTTSTTCIMQEELDLTQMIMNPTIEHLANVYKDLETKSIYLQVSNFFSV